MSSAIAAAFWSAVISSSRTPLRVNFRFACCGVKYHFGRCASSKPNVAFFLSSGESDREELVRGDLHLPARRLRFALPDEGDGGDDGDGEGESGEANAVHGGCSVRTRVFERIQDEARSELDLPIRDRTVLNSDVASTLTPSIARGHPCPRRPNRFACWSSTTTRPWPRRSPRAWSGAATPARSAPPASPASRSWRRNRSMWC